MTDCGPSEYAQKMDLCNDIFSGLTIQLSSLGKENLGFFSPRLFHFFYPFFRCRKGFRMKTLNKGRIFFK